jgi:hypothetical protein
LTTFTLRISDSLAEFLNSAQMRSWLERYLHAPHALPHDPGPGDARVSLTLPQDLVEAVSSHLRCSTSAALRRIAVEQVGASEIESHQAESGCDASPMTSPRPEPPDTSSRSGALAGLLIHALLWILLMGAWFFFGSLKRKGTQEG